MARVITHLDMDCFFCACETKRKPELRGKPVIVGSTGTRGVVSTANYEARKYGIHSALPISLARKACPFGIYLPVDMTYYASESRQIMTLLASFADDMVQVSIDEAYLDLTTLSHKFPDLETLARHIQTEVIKKTRLTCSIGISHSKTIAKIASDYKKPAGITIVDDPVTFLKDMPIQKFPGVGKVTRRYYEQHGIEKIGDLARMNRFKVLENFGMSGVRLQDIARGRDFSHLVHRNGSKSVSRENTFPKDVSDRSHLVAELMDLSRCVHADLKNYHFRTISIKVRYHDFTTITRDFTLPFATRSLDAIRKIVRSLFEESVPDGAMVRLLGVKLTKLVANWEIQTTLPTYMMSDINQIFTDRQQ